MPRYRVDRVYAPSITVEAERVDYQMSGGLTFTDSAGDITHAFALGTWTRVTKED